ncbi:MAG: PDZ domain-containing protein [Bacteroidales bacterium]
MKKLPLFLYSTVLIFLMSSLQLKSADDLRMLRFPDINNGKIAFVYAGDIWTVDADGGDAKRLTSHKGLELFPKISPDGEWIAFSAEYSGSRQVYVMPAEGGTPKQLTYYNDVGSMPPRGGFDHVVLDWSPDSRNIFFRANRTPYGERNGKYFMVSIDGGMEKPLEIPEGGFGVLSPDAEKVCYTPISREFRTWKRYKGGRASDLWIYDLEDSHSEQITDFVGTDQIPVWHEDKIYFASDRDTTFNLYSYDLKSKEVNQITEHSEYDVMWPSGSNGMIAYENGGYLYKLDANTGEYEKVTVNINFDNPNILPYYKNVSENIHSFDISPNGKRAIFGARGEIFTVPAENGEIRNVSKTQGIREIYPNWSPDGKYLTYISDASGEYELYLQENKDGAKPEQITHNSTSWKYKALWSPDSEKLLFFDRTLKLKLLDVQTGNVDVVDKSLMHELRDYEFSPDSRWITYSKASDNGNDAVWTYNIAEGEKHKVTDDTFNDRSPVFSKDGNYVFFLSNRDFNLEFSDYEFDYLYNDATKIYALALREDSPKLFEYKSDEVVPDEDPQGKNNNSTGLDEIIIDTQGIHERVMDFPLSSGSYSNLIAVEDGILFIADGKLKRFNISKEKDEVIMENVRRAQITADGKKFIYQFNSDYGIAELKPEQNAKDGKLDLDKMTMKLDPKKEWQQIFEDGGRILRDYFYVENLHGVDWDAIRDKYRKLLPSVSHRADVDYILGEMVAETNTGHCYVNYGDFEKVDRVETGLLGAELKPDKESGRYIIEKIYASENWNDERRNPLTEQGVNIHEGEYLISIDGQDVTTDENPYKFLENKADTRVEITVNEKPAGHGARSYTIRPVKSELSLMYLDWVESRRKMVEDMSDGKIGYIHVPNTSNEGNRELFRGMYAYHNKEALIIDDRYNGGGFIPDVMTDLLDRETLSYWYRRGLKPDKTPSIAHDGPKAMLINHYSSSGGDAFPYYFKKKDLGVVIGTRTWGGLVGISGNASLFDGGYIAVPTFGIFNEEGEWIIEGVGVYPDIEVVDKPHKIAKGEDPSLEKAVDVLLKKLEENPPEEVTPPEAPDRSGWIEENIRE